MKPGLRPYQKKHYRLSALAAAVALLLFTLAYYGIAVLATGLASLSFIALSLHNLLLAKYNYTEVDDDLLDEGCDDSAEVIASAFAGRERRHGRD